MLHKINVQVTTSLFSEFPTLLLLSQCMDFALCLFWVILMGFQVGLMLAFHVVFGFWFHIRVSFFFFINLSINTPGNLGSFLLSNFVPLSPSSMYPP